METHNQKSEAITRRGRRYQHFKVLILVTLETIVAALFLIWSEEVLEFLHSRINWPCVENQYMMIITAILTILANLLVIYGLTNRKMLFLNVGAFQHGLAGLYFAIAGIYFAIAGLYYKKDFAKEGFPVLFFLVLLGLEKWFFTIDDIILGQAKNMKKRSKSMSDTQMI